MRKLPTVIALITALAAVPSASAAEDLTSLTSIEPLQRILDGFASGEPSEGLFLPGVKDSGIVSQFQFVVNLAKRPTFGYGDVELVPSGVPKEGGIELKSLLDRFDGPLGGTDMLPPLDPWRADNEGRMDITEWVQGWTAYDEQGPITGPIVVSEPSTLVWGMYLAEPFDETCSTTSWVGRIWAGVKFGEAEAPFDAPALSDYFGGTHDALAGLGSRLIEFGCDVGGRPTVRALRVTESGDVRSFGPVKAIVLVKGDRIVFMNPGRQVDAKSDQNFFVTSPGGGPVRLSSLKGVTVPLLVPNPYEDVPLRLSLLADEASRQPGTLVAAPGGQPQTRPLVYTGEDPATAQEESGCSIWANILFLPDLSLLTPEEQAVLAWVQSLSMWVQVAITGDILDFVFTIPGASTESTTIDLAAMQWTSTVSGLDGEEICVTGGTVVTDGPIGAAPPPEEDVPAATPSGGDTPESDLPSGPEGPEEPSTPDSGFPWLFVVVVILILSGGIGYGITRRPTESQPPPDADAPPDTPEDGGETEEEEGSEEEPHSVENPEAGEDGEDSEDDGEEIGSDDPVIAVPGPPPSVSQPDEEPRGVPRIWIVSNDGVDSVHASQVFRVVVELPEQDDPPQTIDVTLRSSRDTETLTIAWDGNVGGPPRYVSQPITLDKGAQGEGKVTIFGLEFSTGGFGGLWFGNGDRVVVSYDGVSTSFIAYDNWIAQGIGRLTEILKVRRRQIERLLESEDPQVREEARRALRRLEWAESWLERDDALETTRLAYLETITRNLFLPEEYHDDSDISRWAQERAYELRTNGIIKGGAGVALSLYRTVVGEASVAGPLFTVATGQSILGEEASGAERALAGIEALGWLFPAAGIDDVADAAAGTRSLRSTTRSSDSAATSLTPDPWRHPVTTKSPPQGPAPFAPATTTPALNPATARQKAAIPTVKRTWAHDVYIHGAPRGSPFPFSTDTGTPISVTRVAEIIRRKDWYRPGVPIRLVSCHSGDSGAAAALAAQLKTRVYAPTHRVYIEADGSLKLLGDPLARPRGGMKYAPPPPEAGWIEFDASGNAVAKIDQNGNRTPLEGGS